jgi:hypothetical protein
MPAFTGNAVPGVLQLPVGQAGDGAAIALTLMIRNVKSKKRFFIVVRLKLFCFVID